MITVEVHGRKYGVEFDYTYQARWTGDVGSPQMHPQDTLCRITDLESNIIVGEGEAMLHHKDNFNRATGRKIAFARALEAAGIDNKADLAIWWDELFVRVKRNNMDYIPNEQTHKQPVK